MTNELDMRLASLHQHQKAKADALNAELTSLKAGLRDHRDALRDDLAGDVQAVEQDLAKLRLRANSLESDLEALEGDCHKACSKMIGVQHRLLLVGLTIVAAAMAIIYVATWTGAQIRQSAMNEAETIQQTNAAVVQEMRRQGEQDLAALQTNLVARRDALEADLTLVGTELAEMGQARDEARAELEHLAELRERVGFRLVEWRNRTVIIVPEGKEIRPWSVAGALRLARYNGQMFRVIDVE